MKTVSILKNCVYFYISDESPTTNTPEKFAHLDSITQEWQSSANQRISLLQEKSQLDKIQRLNNKKTVKELKQV
jgi:hypothetical protein